jgi:hypothetical protein
MRMTQREVTEVARGIVTNELLIADLSKPEWQTSLALITSGLSVSEMHQKRIGLILVPVRPHERFHWINGIAPGCTFECRMVHVNDVDRIGRAMVPMVEALYPGREP